MKGSIVAAITLPFLIATGAAANSSVPEQVGLRLKTDEITTTFRGYLTQYVGGCDVSDWSGPAASNNIRFVSRSTPPAENLRVQLQSLTTGESLEKAYEKEGKGSSDFSLQKLGEGEGDHEIEYQIFDKQTDQLVEKGTFVYTVITSQVTRYRHAQWRSDHLCDSLYSHSLHHCDSILWPHSLYGHGYSRCNGFVRYYPHRYHPSLRRRYGKRLKHKHLHHDHQKHKLHHQTDLKEHQLIHQKPIQAKQSQKLQKVPLQPRHTIERPSAQKKVNSKPQMPRRPEGGSTSPQHVKTPRKVTQPREKAPSRSLKQRELKTKSVPVRRRQSVITPRKRTEATQRSSRRPVSRRQQMRRLRPEQRRTLTPSTSRTAPNRRIQRRVVNSSSRSPRRRAPVKRQ